LQQLSLFELLSHDKMDLVDSRRKCS